MRRLITTLTIVATTALLSACGTLDFCKKGLEPPSRDSQIPPPHG